MHDPWQIAATHQFTVLDLSCQLENDQFDLANLARGFGTLLQLPTPPDNASRPYG
jgi:hypothetical protein